MRNLYLAIVMLISLSYGHAQLATWNNTCNGNAGVAGSATVTPYTVGVNAGCQVSCFINKGNITNYDGGFSDEIFFGYTAAENTSISSIEYSINRQGATFEAWTLFVQVGSTVVVNKVINSSHSGTAAFSEPLNAMVDAGDGVSVYIWPESYPTTPDCNASSVYFALDRAEILGSLLPVELTNFSSEVNKNGVELKWTTATELNNDYFEILKSVNGQHFESIGKVQGNGTTREESHYSFFTDQLETTAYYKLKQYDYDGMFSFSPVISVSKNSNDIDALVSSPRVNANREIEWISSKGGSVRLFNNVGQIMDSYTWSVEGVQSFDISGMNFNSGIVFLVDSDNVVHKLFVR